VKRVIGVYTTVIPGFGRIGYTPLLYPGLGEGRELYTTVIPGFGRREENVHHCYTRVWEKERRMYTTVIPGCGREGGYVHHCYTRVWERGGMLRIVPSLAWEACWVYYTSFLAWEACWMYYTSSFLTWEACWVLNLLLPNLGGMLGVDNPPPS